MTYSRRYWLQCAALSSVVGWLAGLPAARAAQAPNPRILVVFYSRQGHTAKAAEAVVQAAGGRLWEIETDPPYPKDYSGTVEAKKKDEEAGTLPHIAAASKLPDLSGYDFIFIGSPIWSGDLAYAVKSWLAETDLSNKKVALFVTHQGSGLAKAQESLQALVPKSQFASPLAIYWPASDLAGTVGDWVQQVLAR